MVGMQRYFVSFGKMPFWLSQTSTEKTGKSCSRFSLHKAKPLFIEADVSDQKQVEAMVQKVLSLYGRLYGRLDILINNVGINRDALSWKLNEEECDQVSKINLKVLSYALNRFLNR